MINGIWYMIYGTRLTELLLCGIILIFNPLNTKLYAQDTLKNTELLPKINSTQPISLSKAAKRAERKAKFIENHSPRNALLFSIIPGGGQVYNRRYWKLPIVYGGLGGLGYWAIYNRSQFSCYRAAHKAEVDDDPLTINTCEAGLNASQLKLYRDQYLQRYEYALVGVFAFYALTMVDAFVDAHLMKFDVSDDLSLQLRPSIEYHSFGSNNQGLTTGIGLSFQFKNKQKTAPPPF